jgi:hypothetical protein
MARKKASAKTKVESKLKAKSKAKSKAAKQGQSPDEHDIPIQLPEVIPTCGKKPRTCKRDDLSNVHRIIDFKLKRVSKDILSTARKKAGPPIEDLLLEAVLGATTNKSYVPRAVWRQIYEEFPLSEFAATAIDDPGKGDSVQIDEALLEAMVLCHSANPCGRSCDAFVSYLEHSGALDAQTLWGCCRLVDQAPI